MADADAECRDYWGDRGRVTDRKRIFVASAAVLAVAGGLYLALADSSADSRPVAQPAAQPAMPAVQPLAAAPPADAVASPGLDSSRPNDCLIEPSRIVRVNSGVEGVIEAIYVDRGDNVGKGQVVARLRADVDRASAAAAEARAANAHAVRAADARAVYLASVSRRSDEIRTHLARDKVEEAKANADAAAEERRAAAQDQRVAQLEYVRTQRILTEKTVRSPVNGVVVERAMAPGEYRGPSTSHILTIAQINPLNVEVFAPIAQLGAVHVGDMVTVFPEDPVGGSYQAQVKVIDRVFDAASGTFGMRLELPNPGNKLPAGLRCRLEIGGKASPRT